jgi:hypothetical protein
MKTKVTAVRRNLYGSQEIKGAKTLGLYSRLRKRIDYITYFSYKRWDRIVRLNNAIKRYCDPQEVYYQEYNNHECCYSCVGDAEAIGVVLDIWGEDIARSLKRFSDCYTIDEIIEKHLY